MEKSQLVPQNSVFREKFGDKNTYSESDYSKRGIFSNVRINKESGVSEPMLACDPHDGFRLALVCNDFSLRENLARVFISENSGKSWEAKTIPLSGKIRKSTYSDPCIEFDSKGNIYMCAVQRNVQSEAEEGIFLASSPDGGNSWKTDYKFIDYNNSGAILIDRPKIIPDRFGKHPGNIYCTWTEIKNFRTMIMFSKSTDYGISFSRPVPVEGKDVSYSSLAETENGDIYVTYLKDDNRICFEKSADYGNSWRSIDAEIGLSHPGKLSENQYVIKDNGDAGIRISSEPVTTLSGNDLFVTYCASNGNGDESDIFFSKLNTGTLELSVPVKVNGDNTVSDQFLPAIAAEGGKIVITYQDSRNDSKNVMTETYVSVSTDGGKTFRDEKLSTSSFDPLKISVSLYLSDYNSSIICGGRLISVWTDGRNNNFDLYAGEFELNEFIRNYLQ